MLSLERRSLLALLGLSPFASAAACARPVEAREPVVLVRNKVNGEDYYDMRKSVKTLQVGEELALRREPDNPHDRRAIEVLDMAGRKLGYVPRSDNVAVARMMDAGERMRARVTHVSRDWRFYEVRFALEWLRA